MNFLKRKSQHSDYETLYASEKLINEKFHPFIFPFYWDIYMTVVDAYVNWLFLTDSFSLNPGFKVIGEVTKISEIIY